MHTGPVAIEYDPGKAAANLRKHRVSFEEAATAMLDPHALAQEDGTAVGESRWVLLGMSAAGRMLTVVYSLRGDNVRLISARRSTSKEEQSYAR